MESLSKRKRKRTREDLSRTIFVEPEFCPEAVLLIVNQEPRAKGLKDVREKARRHLCFLGWSFWYVIKKKPKSELRYTDPDGKNYISLRDACKGCIDRGLSGGHSTGSILTFVENTETTEFATVFSCESSCNSHSPEKEKKKRKTIRSSRSRSKKSSEMGLRLNKLARRIVASNRESYTSKSVLSLLVEKDIVVPRCKVYCKNKEGKITKDGIKCVCCKKVYGMSEFEAHADNCGGSSTCRIGENMYLEDGRTLVDCEKQLVLLDSKLSDLTTVSSIESDDICSVCNFGGELIICDKCPSTFHLGCIGLEKLPEGDWLCSDCCCCICEKSEGWEYLKDCKQCERVFHLQCLSERDFCKVEIMFCSEKCYQIYSGLSEIVGKSIGVRTKDNLSCKIMKFYSDDVDDDAYAEGYCRLSVALSVLRECFEPIKQTHTNDLVKDIIFNRISVLKRLDFRGFYTVFLERGDEVISVATVRIYGGKVAEVPLVATRIQYQKQGMCRILMDFLEKKLSELGVENMVLPAIPHVLRTWIDAFGFLKMMDCDRKEFLGYTFLQFQDATMCQKILKP